MKRVLIALVAAVALMVGAAGAQAATPAFAGFPGDTGTGPTWSQPAAVAGTVVSVNAAAGSFVANAYVLAPASGTATTPVTITTNPSTSIHVGGVSGAGTVGDLVAGAHFLALFAGSSSDTIQTLVASPATAIYAQVPKQFYAFVGTVTATSTTADTLTVDIMRSLPSGLVAGATTATFTVGPHTFIIGGSSMSGSGFGGLFGGSLSGVSTGDLVAGGLIGDAGLTAPQVEASPLMFLLDLPAPTTTGTSTTTSAANAALKETLKLLHGGKVKVKKGHGKSKKSHGKSKKSSHAGRH